MTNYIPVRCPLHTEFYACGNGFRGCCAEDPCESQLCLYGRDEELSSSAVPESAITAETTGTTTATETTAATMQSPTPAITTAETTSSTSSSTSSTMETTTPSVSTAQMTTTTAMPEETTETQPTSAANAATSSKSQVSAGMIGGVVAGVIALLLIICLVFFLMRRSRRKRGKRFTLVRWHCPRTGYAQANVEGQAASTTETQPLVQPQPPSTAVSNIITRPATAPNPPLRTILEEQSSGISPLQGSQTDSPRTVPSAVSPQTVIYHSPRRDSCSKAALPRPPNDIHPAFRQDSCRLPALASETDDILPAPIPIIRRASSTPELSDTGFRVGRIELPETGSCRELINIPLAQRQKQLYRNAGLPCPIITPDGAILSANFYSLPVDLDSHAMSFMEYGPESADGRGKRMRLSMLSKRKSKTASASSPFSGPLSGSLSPPPSYRAEWSRGSREMKEKVKERFRKKS
ncbi:hypothetical protein BDV06DRAFT_43549 [Aspergillus oleicola]